MTVFSESLWLEWLKKEKEAFANNKHAYLHFDRKVKLDCKIPFLKELFQQPKLMAKHSFYPFIKKITKTPRYRLGKANKKQIIVKERPICYSSHFDSLIYSYYAYLLAKQYEITVRKEGIHENVSAYRELNKSNIDFAWEAFEYISSQGSCTAIALDIKSFFDNLNHLHSKKAWLMLLEKEKLPIDHYTLYKSLTRYSYAYRNTILRHLGIDMKKISKPLSRLCEPATFRQALRAKDIIKTNKTETGIPQGAAISAVLSNIYMIDFDKQIQLLASQQNFLYRRYCDDILVVCKTEETRDIKEIIYKYLEQYGLTINTDKEDIVSFRLDDGKLNGYGFEPNADGIYIKRNLQYLGFEFSGRAVFIRPSSLSKYHRKLKSNVKLAVKRTHSKSSRSNQVFRRKLFSCFSHLGKNNFIQYASRAAEIMESQTIKKQVAGHMKKINKALNNRIKTT